MQLYLFVDYDQAVFKLGTLNKDAIGENAVSSGTCTSNERLSATNIGLIVLGIVVFLLLCSLLFLYRWWWKERYLGKRRESPIDSGSRRSSSPSNPQDTIEEQPSPIRRTESLPPLDV
jgi:hypothetical protein